MQRLQHKVAVVTGGAAGIGRAACRLLAREGARVAVTDVQDAAGAALVAELLETGAHARYWHLDVANEAQVQDVFRQVADHLGGIDVLVNNAGSSGADRPGRALTEAEWQRTIDLNVKGVFLCTRHAVPYMRRGREGRGGSIINLSSVCGIVSAQDIPPDHASKGAVGLMTKTDALLYAADGIRVNSVHAGFIWTPRVEAMGERFERGVEGYRRHLERLHPIGRVGEPEDVAHGIVYLASDESRFVTGSALVIDGGYSAR
ncbi:SDR family NAD(P)-dependent oxidoreductase [Thiohalocapsa sp. ML1]|jgi:NAD(P)-dependent dehydrogenase (short-subunit alcohol dehydrogenase family)|uniref:SDR family NAD(P)-dependent oxidoreductase n=1 Tax=Thiohalocapsa sp. ML1 TaxID=1431688 RepID=UPI000731F9BB|nr:glucose 1-dehydrogenase [Thiohalocapsa sp. ML1]